MNKYPQELRNAYADAYATKCSVIAQLSKKRELLAVSSIRSVHGSCFSNRDALEALRQEISTLSVECTRAVKASRDAAVLLVAAEDAHFSELTYVVGKKG